MWALRTVSVGLTMLLSLTSAAAGQRSGTSPDDWIHSQNETVFGIEFRSDRIVGAANLGNGTSIALASIEGNKDYRALLHTFYQISEQTAKSQQPPDDTRSEGALAARGHWQSLVLKPERSWHDWYQVRILGRPEYPDSVFEYDNYQGDEQVATLSTAVSDLHERMLNELHDLGIDMTTVPDRPYAELTIPSFFYTAIKPSGAFPLDPEPADWYIPFASKFAAAVHRAGFRRTQSTWPTDIMGYHDRGVHLQAAPAATVAGAHLDECFSMSAVAQEVCNMRDMRTRPSSLVVVVDRGNAGLSLWTQRVNTARQEDWWIWTPWSTYPELGGQQEGYGGAEGLQQYWREVVGRIHVRLQHVSPHDRRNVSILLMGDTWDALATQDIAAAMQESGVGLEIVADASSPLFRASIGAAEMARNLMQSAHSCTAGLEHEIMDTDLLDREL